MPNYIRASILSYDELAHSQRKSARDQYGNGDAMLSGQYVPDPCDPRAVLSLASFLRVKSGVWDGFHGVSAFSGYFIKVSRDQSQCVVAYRHW